MPGGRFPMCSSLAGRVAVAASPVRGMPEEVAVAAGMPNAAALMALAVTAWFTPRGPPEAAASFIRLSFWKASGKLMPGFCRMTISSVIAAGPDGAAAGASVVLVFCSPDLRDL